MGASIMWNIPQKKRQSGYVFALADLPLNMSNLQDIKQFWGQPIGKLIEQLTSSEAKRRLALYEPKRLQPSKKTDAPTPASELTKKFFQAGFFGKEATAVRASFYTAATAYKP